MNSNQEPNRKQSILILNVFYISGFSIKAIIFSVSLLLCISLLEAIGQSENDEISKYERLIQQRPNDSELRKNLGIAYASIGRFDKASEELNKAMEIERNKGYQTGLRDVSKKEGIRIYTIYVLLSIALGLLIGAAIITILGWSELDEKLRTMQKNKKIKAYVNNIGIKLNSDLRQKATDIAQSKEKLKDAIHRETDPNLIKAASEVLPRLDELAKQASLLLELQQNLTEYVKYIEPSKLDMTKLDCENKIRNENDEEAKQALDYQLKQIKNKQMNFAKAKAKIRTCEAVIDGIIARIDATSLGLMSLPSLIIKKQEFFEKISSELDEELNLTKNAADAVIEETSWA